MASIIDDGVVDVFFNLDELSAFSSRGNVPVWEGSIFDLYAEEGGIDYINGKNIELEKVFTNKSYLSGLDCEIGEDFKFFEF